VAIGRELAQRLDGGLALANTNGTRSGPGACFELWLPIELPTGSGR